MQQLKIGATVFLTHGDGTKNHLEDGSGTPLRTLKSGPHDSMNGAAALAAVQEAIIVDVGGTTTDIGLYKENKPVFENSRFFVCGIRCNFTNARLNNFALGGGSIIRVALDGSILFGPDSVGHNFEQKP